MGQRDYLILLIFLFIHIFKFNNVLASAWLRDKGKYFFSSSFDFFTLDKQLLQDQSFNLDKVSYQLNDLYIKKSIITADHRINLRTKSNLIKDIDQKIDKLKKVREKFSNSYQLYFFSCFFEYGVSKNYNLGGKILFQSSLNLLDKDKIYRATNLELFTKHFLFEIKGYYFSLEPKIYISKNIDSDLTILLGKQGKYKKSNLFSVLQIGFGGRRKSINTICNFSQGIEYKNIMLLGQTYNRFFVRDKSLSWSKEEISIVKKFPFNSNDYYAIHIGYFRQYKFKPIKKICTGYKIGIWISY